MLPFQQKTIAIDFDGTIVEDRYPQIGRPMIFAFETMKRMQADGHRLILWTYRDGPMLEEAVSFCRQHGIEFYAVNKNFPEEEYTPAIPRKLHADLFIDDRNFGGFPGWGKIYQDLTGEIAQKGEAPKRGVLSFLKKQGR